jgi:undecaprenyl-diphosphatase
LRSDREIKSNTNPGGLLVLLVAILGILATADLFQPLDDAFVIILGLQKGSSPYWLIAMMQGISWIGGGAQRYAIVGLLGLILWRWRGWRYGAALVGTSALSNIVSSVLKSLLNRPRPSLIEHLDHVDSASYPSGHATSAAVVYLFMIWLVPLEQRKYWVVPMLFLFFATGLSRIMLGVHYPSDVIGGWMLGGAFALGAMPLVRAGDRPAG